MCGGDSVTKMGNGGSSGDSVTKKIAKRPDTWCSAKVLACHEAGPGSIPGWGNKDALISHKSITWSLGLDRAPSFGAGLRSSVSDPS